MARLKITLSAFINPKISVFNSTHNDIERTIKQVLEEKFDGYLSCFDVKINAKN